MEIINHYYACVNFLEKAKGLPLCIMRVTLAYGFYGPAIMKLQSLHRAAEVFQGLGIPAPLFSTYLVATTEMLGAILLLFGFATRLIAIPLMFEMSVAVLFVHWKHGFHAAQNGVEIPLYYLIMLFTLFIHGSGRFSIDRLIKKKFQEEESFI